MRTLYLECNMGAAGDMLTAALLDLFDEPEKLVGELNALGIPEVSYEFWHVKKCGISGLQMHVKVHGREEVQETVPLHREHHAHLQEDTEQEYHTHIHEDAEDAHYTCAHEDAEDAHHTHVHEDSEHTHYTHSHGDAGDVSHTHSHGDTGDAHHMHGHAGHHHTSMAEIREIINGLRVSDAVKNNALAVYQRIAQAESQVHGESVEEIHFHEVGSMDAVADVVAVCYLTEKLHPDRIIASPVRTGYGQVHCAHGILPVPAPAVSLLTEGMPVYGGNLEGEFLTPTGAALLGQFVTGYGELPVMRVRKTGYGMGQKEFEAVNCVRAMLGDGEEKPLDEIVELCCNLDDMIPENIGYVTELLMSEGALDVYTTNIQMKKNRPGILLTCMCRGRDKEKFLHLIFLHTTTLGVREYFCRRYGLKRHIETVQTRYGEVHMKCASGYGVTRRKPEYEDVAAIARRTGEAVETIKSHLLESE